MDETYQQKLNKVPEQKRKQWQLQQLKVKKLIKEVDELPCTLDKINLIAGVDISFSSKYQSSACAGLIIYNILNRKIVYEDFEYVILQEDYIPGFLAFRELGPTLQLFTRLKKKRPELWPQVIMVDGNGILHKRQCGYACHLGVLLNTAAFGCGKKFFDVDGLHQSEVEDYLGKRLGKYGEHEVIKSKSGRIWCTGIRTSDDQNKNIFVSVGTKISLDSATKLTLKLLVYEVPEPIRLVDAITRKYIRNMNENHYKKAKSYNMVYL